MDPYRMLNQTTGHLEVCTVADGVATIVVTDADGVEIDRRTVAAPDPVTEHAEITLADVAAALRDPLANLTASSASTTVRTAILNQRAALDALLGQLETP